MATTIDSSWNHCEWKLVYGILCFFCRYPVTCFLEHLAWTIGQVRIIQSVANDENILKEFK